MKKEQFEEMIDDAIQKAEQEFLEKGIAYDATLVFEELENKYFN